MTRLRKALWLSALIGVFLMPYCQLRWWPFPLSTVLLLVLLGWKMPAGASLRRAGLPTRGRDVAWSLLVAVVLWSVFRFAVVPRIAEECGLTLDAFTVWRTTGFAFQALNEEIVTGALLLRLLVRASRRPATVAFAVAVVFALLHFCLYRFGLLQQTLGLVTLVSLTLVGLVRNTLILGAGHVGFAWAVHAAWNLVMFSGRWVSLDTGQGLSEPQVFEAFLTTGWVMVPAAVAAAVGLGVVVRRGSRLDGCW